MPKPESQAGQKDSFMNETFREFLNVVGKMRLLANHLKAQSEAVPDGPEAPAQIRTSQLLTYMAKDATTLFELYKPQIDQVEKSSSQS